jgi:hypothetical protein
VFACSSWVHPEHADLPGRAHPEALQDLDARGLPGPVRPEQDEHLTAGRREVGSVEHIHRPVPHPQATNTDHRDLTRQFTEGILRVHPVHWRD